jgi:hypothetical protein
MGSSPCHVTSNGLLFRRHYFKVDSGQLFTCIKSNPLNHLSPSFLKRYDYRRCPDQLASSDRELMVLKVCRMNSAGVKRHCLNTRTLARF